MIHKSLIGIAVSALMLLVMALPVAAQTKPFETIATQAILIDGKTGRTLFEKDADAAIPPASMSKLMTMVMVFEALKAGKLSLDQEITISENAWRNGGALSGGSTMYAELNSKVKLRDLIQGVVVQSANDACIAIAEAMAGTESAFAERMTKRGRELGLKNAVFRNATGLPDPDHRMSVRDLSMLARYIILNFPEYYKYYSEPEFTWNKITQKNRNPLLKDYPGADGMKTGYTKEAGYGLVGSAVRDDRRLIMVVAGLKSINDRKIAAQQLLDWGFGQFHSVDLIPKGDRISRATVWGGTERTVRLLTTEEVKLALSPEEQQKIEARLIYEGPLMAPVTAGQPVGHVEIVVDNLVYASVPVVAATDVPAETSMWSRALDSLMIMAFGS